VQKSDKILGKFTAPNGEKFSVIITQLSTFPPFLVTQYSQSLFVNDHSTVIVAVSA